MASLRLQLHNLSLGVIPICLLITSCSQSEQVSYESGGMTQTFVAKKDAGKNFLLPIYPGATPTGETLGKGTDEENAYLMLSSADPVEKVAEFYKKELKDNGWTIGQQQMVPELVNIQAKKEKLEGSVMISADGKDKTSISLSVSVEPEGTPEVSKEDFTPDKINPPTD